MSDEGTTLTVESWAASEARIAELEAALAAERNGKEQLIGQLEEASRRFADMSVASEREACAVLAEIYPGTLEQIEASEAIAAAIRARGKKHGIAAGLKL